MNLGGTIRLNRKGFFVLVTCLVLLAMYVFSNKNTQEKDKSQNSPEDQLISVVSVLKYAIKAAQLGGLEVYNSKDSLTIKSKGKTKEGANDSVTSADFKSHCVMSRILQDQFPSVKIISEEKANCDHIVSSASSNIPLIALPQVNDDKLSAKELTLWIDPLDATQEYTEKLYKFVTTMVCLSYRGQPIVGVIHDPFQNQTSWAWVNKIKSDNLKTKEQKNSDIENTQKQIIISRSHAGEVKNVLLKALGEQNIIENAGGAGYKVLQVANGNADAYIHTTAIKKWDICAGNAILNALNGKLSTLTNDDIDYSNGEKVVNDKGLIATLYNHDSYVNKLSEKKLE